MNGVKKRTATEVTVRLKSCGNYPDDLLRDVSNLLVICCVVDERDGIRLDTC